mmetsp:Transcript_34112/g.95916  ORF Transcript_34112/g.95916 Transcript_34112/m.95916 type:complete len:233 (+) Transcript_34112:1014-1712(+)
MDQRQHEEMPEVPQAHREEPGVQPHGLFQGRRLRPRVLLALPRRMVDARQRYRRLLSVQYLRQGFEGGEARRGGEDAPEGQARPGQVHVLFRAFHGPRPRHETDSARGGRHRVQGAAAARQARDRNHRAAVPVRCAEAGSRLPPRAEVDLRLRVLPGRHRPREEPVRAPPEEPRGEDRPPARNAREGLRGDVLQQRGHGRREQVQGLQEPRHQLHERDSEVPRTDPDRPRVR